MYSSKLSRYRKMSYFLFCLVYFISSGLDLGYTKVVPCVHTSTLSYNEYSPEETFKCTTDDECQSHITGSKCENNFCKCPGNYLLSSDASRCLAPVEEYGSPCEDNIQCSNLLFSGGVCENNVCSCKTGYHYLKGHCWKSVGLNEKCFKDEQCFSSYEYVGFKCVGNVCKCRQNYYERLNSGCRRIRNFGESCNLDDDCSEGGVCESMKCTQGKTGTVTTVSNTTVWESRNTGICSEGMFESDGRCVRELGMTCRQDADCNHIKSTICLDNYVCACQPVLFIASEDNRKCLKVTRGKVDDIHESSCTNDRQCAVFGANGYCKDKRCSCRSGSYFEVKNKFCWSIKALGEVCTRDEDCNPEVSHALCGRKEKKCVCQDGYHPKGLECVPDALKVGDSCANDAECLFPNSFCNSNKTCACKKYFYLENGQCNPGVGTVCNKDEDCAYVEKTVCDLQLNQCVCEKNYTNSKDYKYCLPVADYKQSCNESFQCELLLGELGECKENVCQCKEGTHYSRRCYKSKYVGETCTRIQDCFPGNDTDSVICLKGICSCNYDYTLDHTKICVKTNSATTVSFYTVLLTSIVFFATFR